MPIALRGKAKAWQRRDRRTQFAIWSLWLAGTASFVFCCQFIADKTIWPFVFDAPEQVADLAVRMVPPDWTFIGVLWRPMWDTINRATLGTVMAIVLAVPIAYCAARNTTPSAAVLRPIAIFVIVSTRSINSLIWALMLVTIIGPGGRASGPRLRDRAAVYASIRGHFCVSMGYQHPRVDRARPRRSGRHWPTVECGHYDARLD